MHARTILIALALALVWAAPAVGQTAVDFKQLLIKEARRNGLVLKNLTAEGAISSPGELILPFRLSFKQCRLKSLVSYLHQVEAKWPGARTARILKLSKKRGAAWDAALIVSWTKRDPAAPAAKTRHLSSLVVLRELGMALSRAPRRFKLKAHSLYVDTRLKGKSVAILEARDQLAGLAIERDLEKNLYLVAKTRSVRADSKRGGFQVELALSIRAKQPAKAPPVLLKAYSVIWEQLDPHVPSVKAPPPPPAKKSSALELVSVFVDAKNPQRSNAVVSRDRRQSLVQIGDTFEGRKVVGISADGVTWEVAGKRELQRLPARR
jgi:hypothetical protein